MGGECYQSSIQLRFYLPASCVSLLGELAMVFHGNKILLLELLLETMLCLYIYIYLIQFYLFVGSSTWTVLYFKEKEGFITWSEAW